MEKITIPRTVFEMGESLKRAKQIMARLEKGEQFIDAAIKNRSVAKAGEAVALYGRLAKELNDELEGALFMHETISTGRTTVINRKGKPITTTPFRPSEERVVDLFTLNSMRQLKEVFGEEHIVEFETDPE